MKEITIAETLNTKTGKFNKVAFANRIKNGEFKIFEKNNKDFQIKWEEIEISDFLKNCWGNVRIHANLESDKNQPFHAYLGTSIQYKFTK